MRKPAFWICANKDADQQRSNNCAADQRISFQYIDSTIPPLPKFKISKPLAIFFDCTARFVSDLVRNHEARFSHNEAHMSPVVRKPGFCICENKDADQLRGNR